MRQHGRFNKVLKNKWRLIHGAGNIRWWVDDGQRHSWGTLLLVYLINSQNMLKIGSLLISRAARTVAPPCSTCRHTQGHPTVISRVVLSGYVEVEHSSLRMHGMLMPSIIRYVGVLIGVRWVRWSLLGLRWLKEPDNRLAQMANNYLGHFGPLLGHSCFRSHRSLKARTNIELECSVGREAWLMTKKNHRGLTLRMKLQLRSRSFYVNCFLCCSRSWNVQTN